MIVRPDGPTVLSRFPLPQRIPLRGMMQRLG
jgi:hypothetical protein